MIPPAIAELRHRLTLEGPVETPDLAGGATISWTAEKTLWAKIEPLTGREGFDKDLTEAELSHEIIIRFDPAIEPKKRLIKNDRIFAIISVINWQEKNRWMRLLAREEHL